MREVECLRSRIVCRSAAPTHYRRHVSSLLFLDHGLTLRRSLHALYFSLSFACWKKLSLFLFQGFPQTELIGPWASRTSSPARSLAPIHHPCHRFYVADYPQSSHGEQGTLLRIAPSRFPTAHPQPRSYPSPPLPAQLKAIAAIPPRPSPPAPSHSCQSTAQNGLSPPSDCAAHISPPTRRGGVASLGRHVRSPKVVKRPSLQDHWPECIM